MLHYYHLHSLRYLLEVGFGRRIRHGPQIVEQRVIPRVLARLAINQAEDVIDGTRLGHLLTGFFVNAVTVQSTQSVFLLADVS